MANKLEPKTEGTTGACNVCGTNVIWVSKSWQGKTTLTLRNVSGQQAHNKKDGSNWVCNTGLGLDGFDTPVSKEPFVPKLITKKQQALWIGIVDKATEYTLLAEDRYGIYPQMDNPAKRGMVTKLAYDMMENYQKVDDDD
jgi:hypothetical protein